MKHWFFLILVIGIIIGELLFAAFLLTLGVNSFFVLLSALIAAAILAFLGTQYK